MITPAQSQVVIIQARSISLRVATLHSLAILGWFLVLLAAPVGCSRATSDEDARRIENNLRQLWEAGLQHMLETGKTEARYEDLVGPQKYLKETRPVNGEDYQQLVINLRQDSLSVRARDGREIIWNTASSPFQQVRDKIR